MKIDFAGNKRIFVIMLAVLVLFGLLVAQLADLTIVKGQELSETSQNRKYRVLTTSGTRGIIMDANGIPLAYDQKSYDVHFYKDSSKTSGDDRAKYTNILMEAFKIIEKNGGKINDTFNIKRDENGAYYFDFGITNTEAIAKRETRWRSDMYVSSTETYPDAESIYITLRKRYQIPEEMGYDEARKLLSVWQELQLNASKAYMPVVIANNVDIQTVAQIEARSDLEGVEIAEGTTRVYPRRDMAAHVIGYMGKMYDADQIASMEELGYTANDLVGVSGVESAMEMELTPNTSEKRGRREVEVNNLGQIMREFSSTEAKSGNSVMLSLDTKLQLVVQEALAENIELIREAQEEEIRKPENAEEYQDVDRDKLKLANGGACVVLEVNTGKVLAMVSLPSFDLNLFTGGISDEDYAVLRDDPAAPLFNKAVSSKASPGSIFKMVTAIGALSDGSVSLAEEIDDEGPFLSDKSSERKGDINYTHLPACWAYYEGITYKHQDQTVAEGLKNSCNYFFYTLADRMGIDRLNYWGDQFGLDKKTGVEVSGEATGQIGGQQVLFDTSKDLNNQGSFMGQMTFNNVRNYLRDTVGPDRGVEYSEIDLVETTNALMAIETTQTGQTLLNSIRSILSEKLDISPSIATAKDWDSIIRDYLLELRWNPNRTVLVGIGQEPILVTPVAVARYVAAVANGGTVYDVSVVDKIIGPDGAVIKEVKPSVLNEIDIPDEYLEVIDIGMSDVLSTEAHGTASTYFKDWKYVNVMAGKTGTAQVSQIDLENTAWFVAYAPTKEIVDGVVDENSKTVPEIAVVTYIPNGWAGGRATYTAKKVVEYYLDQKQKTMELDIPTVNSVVSPEDWDKSDIKASKPPAASPGNDPESQESPKPDEPEPSPTREPEPEPTRANENNNGGGDDYINPPEEGIIYVPPD